MKKHIVYIPLLLFLSLFACRQQTTVRPLLHKAEMFMQDHPDSSLLLLESVSSPQKLSAEDYATWCLLVTEARDKNYVKQTSDSLINVAVRYFAEGEDPLQAATALYYRGRILQDQGKTEEAADMFVRALDIGKEFQDYCFLFLVSSRLGTLYGYQDMAELALTYYQKAGQYAIQSGDSSSLSYACSYIGRAYGMQNDWENAVESYKKGEEVALAINDTSALLLSLGELSNIYTRMYSFAAAKNCFIRMDAILQKDNMEDRTKIYLGMGDLCRYMGQYDSAVVYLEKALSYKNPYTEQSVYQCLYYLYEELRDYEKAIQYNNLYWTKTDSINEIANKDAVLAVEAKYDHEKLEKENSLLLLEKEKKEKMTFSLIVIFLLLLSCVVIIYQWQLLKKNKEVVVIRSQLVFLLKESEEYKEKICANQKKIDSLTLQLKENKKELEDTVNLELEKNSLIEENSLLKGKNDKLQKEIQSKFIMLSHRDEEFAVYKQKMEKKEACPNILVRLNKEKKRLQEEDWDELLLMVNIISSDFTRRLSGLYPTLSENDIRFCCLLRLGYMLSDLCTFLGVLP